MKHERTQREAHAHLKQTTDKPHLVCTVWVHCHTHYCGDARACDGGCDGRTYDGGSALYPLRSPPPDDASHGGGGTGPPVALCGAEPGPWGGGIIACGGPEDAPGAPTGISWYGPGCAGAPACIGGCFGGS